MLHSRERTRPSLGLQVGSYEDSSIHSRKPLAADPALNSLLAQESKAEEHPYGANCSRDD